MRKLYFLISGVLLSLTGQSAFSEGFFQQSPPDCLLCSYSHISSVINNNGYQYENELEISEGFQHFQSGSVAVEAHSQGVTSKIAARTSGIVKHPKEMRVDVNIEGVVGNSTPNVIGFIVPVFQATTATYKLFGIYTNDFTPSINNNNEVTYFPEYLDPRVVMDFHPTVAERPQDILDATFNLKMSYSVSDYGSATEDDYLDITSSYWVQIYEPTLNGNWVMIQEENHVLNDDVDSDTMELTGRIRPNTMYLIKSDLVVESNLGGMTPFSSGVTFSKVYNLKQSSFNVTVVSAIPEPSSLQLIVAGLVFTFLLVAAKKRRFNLNNLFTLEHSR